MQPMTRRAFVGLGTAGAGVIPAAAMVLVGGLALRIVVVFAPQVHA